LHAHTMQQELQGIRASLFPAILRAITHNVTLCGYTGDMSWEEMFTSIDQKWTNYAVDVWGRYYCGNCGSGLDNPHAGKTTGSCRECLLKVTYPQSTAPTTTPIE
jgi:hypothetical protein